MDELGENPQPEERRKPEPLRKFKKIEPKVGESPQRAFKRKAIAEKKFLKQAAKAAFKDAQRDIDEKTREQEILEVLAKIKGEEGIQQAPIEVVNPRALLQQRGQVNGEIEDQDDLVFPGAASRIDRVNAIDVDEEAEKELQGDRNLAELRTEIDSVTSPYFRGYIDTIQRHGFEAKRHTPQANKVKASRFLPAKTVVEQPKAEWSYDWAEVKNVGSEENLKFSSSIWFDQPEGDRLAPAELHSYELLVNTIGPAPLQQHLTVGMSQAGIKEVSLEANREWQTERILREISPDESQRGVEPKESFAWIDRSNTDSNYDQLLKKVNLVGNSAPYHLSSTIRMILEAGEPKLVIEYRVPVYNQKSKQNEETKYGMVFDYYKNEDEFRRRLSEEELRTRNGQHTKNDIVSKDMFMGVLQSSLRLQPAAPRSQVSAK